MVLLPQRWVYENASHEQPMDLSCAVLRPSSCLVIYQTPLEQISSSPRTNVAWCFVFNLSFLSTKPANKPHLLRPTTQPTPSFTVIFHFPPNPPSSSLERSPYPPTNLKQDEISLHTEGKVGKVGKVEDSIWTSALMDKSFCGLLFAPLTMTSNNFDSNKCYLVDWCAINVIYSLSIK